MIQEDVLATALTAVEIQETTLIAWGAIHGAWTRPELLDRIGGAAIGSNAPEDVLGDLLERALVVETPQGLFRSRMAETIRLLSTLRQQFRSQRWEQGANLVLDQRFLHRPRRRPRRDQDQSVLHEGMRDAVPKHVIDRVLDAISPPRVSGFQARSWDGVIEAASNIRSHRALMITAGTGSGKTLAFYMPMLATVVHDVDGDSTRATRCLSIYPRNELLKDQLKAVLNWVRAINAVRGDARGLRVGTWFGPTPHSAYGVRQGWARSAGWRQVRNKGWICPFLTCLSCDGQMVWGSEDLARNRERLVCEDCGDSVESELVLTRPTAAKAPPDILLTTTESVNRQLASTDTRRVFGVGTKKLKTILLDEVHTYEGTSGAQTAMLLRRLRHALDHPLLWVGLSATLQNPEDFASQLVGVSAAHVTVIRPYDSEMEETGAEYMLALRHDPMSGTGSLSTSIQACMALERCLDSPEASDSSDDPLAQDCPDSKGVFGSRMFAFTDKLDVTNRLFWDLLDAEGQVYPGRMKSEAPLTLAHLRSEQQERVRSGNQEPAMSRDVHGQWWWLAQYLGHNIENDEALGVGRTSSQDPGVDSRAEITVATATLEVGYDDERLGAVLQHKAPRDAARFLQRKGRAGRDMRMRPWTVVVLSDWGRDRYAWELYDQMFDPVVEPRRLPLGNRYILRMQAVYALMDWLSTRIRIEGSVRPSVWSDLTAPAADLHKGNDARIRERRARQEQIATILREVLSGGPKYADLARHLRYSLGFSGSSHDQFEVDALLWQAPRSLMMAVIPTILRRLESQWAAEESVTKRSIPMHTPVPEFIPGNLFNELLVPEVSVTFAPNRFGRVQDPDALPALRALRELMPGNVTRHFGISSDARRHWVPLPESNGTEIRFDIDSHYVTSDVATLRVGRSNEVHLLRPEIVALDSVPNEVRDASKMQPDWDVDLDPLGGGRDLPLQSGALWGLVQRVRVHMHVDGGGVRVRRFAETATGRYVTANGAVPARLRFIHGSEVARERERIALGFEIDADAIEMQLTLPEPGPVGPEERRVWLEHQVMQSHALPLLASSFDRSGMAEALIVILAENPEAELDHLSDEDMEVLLADALVRLSRLDSSGSRQSEHLWSLIQDSDVLTELRNIASSVSKGRDDEWEAWWSRRLAASAGVAFLEAVLVLCPQIDEGDLVVDLDPRSVSKGREFEVWISESSPGGSGLVEMLQGAISDDPGHFRRLADKRVQPADLETLDPMLRDFLRLWSENSAVKTNSARLTRGWNTGHDEAGHALRLLREQVASAGTGLSRLAWTAISTRILGPGSDEGLPSALLDWINSWDSCEELCGMSLSPRLAGAVLARQSTAWDEILKLDSSAGEEVRARAIANVLWPRRDSARLTSGTGDHFGLLPSPDVALLRRYVVDSSEPIEIDGWDPECADEIRERLADSGDVTVIFEEEAKSHVRSVLLEMQTKPVDLGDLLVYPDIASVEEESGTLSVRLTIREGVQ